MSKKAFFVFTSLACGSLAMLAADQSSNRSYTYSSSSSSSSSTNNTDTSNQGYWSSGNGGKKNGQNNYVITPSAQPVVQNFADFFVTADFIWWKGNLEDTGYAMSGFAPAVGTSTSGGHLQYPHYKWEPGFKVGLGTTFNHDGWDLYLEYTWWRMNHGDHNHNSISSSANSLLWSTFSVSPGGAVTPDPIQLSSASARSKLQLNVLDFDLGRNFWISKYLTLRPNFGLKFAWVHNQESIRYTVDPAAAVTLGITSHHIGVNQRFFGVGIMAGLDTAWHFNRNWSIYGDLGLSALWTSFKSTRDDHSTTGAGVTYTSLDTNLPRSRNHSVEPVLELGLGLMYQTWFHQDEYEFWIKLGWEEQVWWDHNQFIDVSGNRHGNMTFQGLTLDFGLAF